MRPFEEIKDGMPIWRIQVEDPAAASEFKFELAGRSLQLPQGPVVALAVTLHDGQGKPVIFHHAMLPQSEGAAKLKASNGFILAYERHGYLSAHERVLRMDCSQLSGGQSSEAALADYVEGWRRELPLQKSATATWAAMEAKPLAGKASGFPLWAKLLLALAAAAGTAAWFYFKSR